LGRLHALLERAVAGEPVVASRLIWRGLLAAGTLPPGLKLATDGTLAGTPKRKGTYRFTLSATNGIGTPAKAGETVTVR
jgi:Putative Ig domain